MTDQFSPEERATLSPYFTNLDGPVFALVNLPEVVKGALFARYSRSPKSLRRLFLDEFLTSGTLPGAPAAPFDTTRAEMFDTYRELLPILRQHFAARFPRDAQTSDAAYRMSIRAKALDTLRGLLPAATTSNVGIYGTGQAYENLLIRMRAHPLLEVRAYADMMLVELRKVIPAFLRRVDLPDRGGAWSSYLAETRRSTSSATTARSATCSGIDCSRSSGSGCRRSTGRSCRRPWSRRASRIAGIDRSTPRPRCTTRSRPRDRSRWRPTPWPWHTGCASTWR